MKKVILLLTVSMMMNGCATVISGSQDSVEINTMPTSAICDIKGEQYMNKIQTPTELDIPRSAGHLSVTCENDAGMQGAATLNSEFNEIFLGNILLLPVIYIAGFIDLISGAAFEYEDLDIQLFEQRTTNNN